MRGRGARLLPTQIDPDFAPSAKKREREEDAVDPNTLQEGDVHDQPQQKRQNRNRVGDPAHERPSQSPPSVPRSTSSAAPAANLDVDCSYKYPTHAYQRLLDYVLNMLRTGEVRNSPGRELVPEWCCTRGNEYTGGGKVKCLDPNCAKQWYHMDCLLEHERKWAEKFTKSAGTRHHQFILTY